MHRQAVELAEVAWLGPPHPELFLKSSGGVLSDVLVECPGRVSGLEHSLHVFESQGTEARRVTESGVESLGGVALTQEQDFACASTPLARRTRTQSAEEVTRLLTHALEGDFYLIQADSRAPRRALVEAQGV